jgi:hypothetical protein
MHPNKYILVAVASAILLQSPLHAEPFFSQQDKDVMAGGFMAALVAGAAVHDANLKAKKEAEQQRQFQAVADASAARDRAAAQAEVDRSRREAAAEAERAKSEQKKLVDAAAEEWRHIVVTLKRNPAEQRSALVRAMLKDEYRSSALLNDPVFKNLYRNAVSLYLDQYASSELKQLGKAQSKWASTTLHQTVRDVYKNHFLAELAFLRANPDHQFAPDDGHAAQEIKAYTDTIAKFDAAQRALAEARAQVPTYPGSAPTPPSPFAFTSTRKKYETEKAAYDARLSSYNRNLATANQKVAQAQTSVTALSHQLQTMQARLETVSGEPEDSPNFTDVKNTP